ncbi:hypothetical protein DB032_19420 [Chromobacterium sp. Panama]|uniref:TnsD family Tn7-like transposition protein n=1 Tax=Chromobacterium sp. Panama TaxID=2161826 RepID=UPI000D31CC7A|nr:TnsD family Tn7-like transposition protein [Chromobacterium sp. Panama]PTU66941.1 hypothetical protein DB032_19420 [Chromobacterium sp. Panama]
MTAMNRNILVAPHFPDGEIVNAFLTRILSYGGVHSLSLACRQLLNRRPSLDGMPNYLGLFHQELGYLYGDIDTLIDKHTEFNFICCGLPKAKFSAQRARLIDMYKGPVRLCRLPLLFGVSEQSYLQCSECEEQQKREFGFSFIHRRMGVPFVNVCPIHGVPLCASKRQLLLFDAHCQSKPNSYQVVMTMELGKRIEYCMETPVYLSRYDKDSVIDLFKLSGWIDDNNRFHLIDFTRKFSIFFDGAFSDERLKILCQSERHIENAIRALLRNEKSIHPEWCVLFAWFAEQQPYTGPAQSTVAIPIEAAHRRLVSPKVMPLREAVAAELAKHKALQATAMAMGISASLLNVLCKRYEINVSWRPKTLKESVANLVKKELVDGKSPSEVAAKFQISLTSVYRQLAILTDVPLPREKALSARIESDKAEWLNAIQTNPEMPRNSLRKKYPTLWMRLYRNAHDWFVANQPTFQLPNNGVRASPPCKLLCNLNSALAEAADVCTAPDKKRINMSRYRFQELTRVPIYALKKCEDNGFVEKREEQHDDFVRARLKRLAGLVGRPCAIAKKAGLREETIRKALKKKTD